MKLGSNGSVGERVEDPRFSLCLECLVEGSEVGRKIGDADWNQKRWEWTVGVRERRGMSLGEEEFEVDYRC